MELTQAMTGGGDLILASGAILDLSLIGQRIVNLADLSVKEHIQAVGRTQADGLWDLVRQVAAEAEAN